MLVKPMRSCEPDPKYDLKFPVLASYKLDGIRLLKEGRCLTKSLKELPNKYVNKWVVDNLFDGFDSEVISGPPNIPTAYGTTFSAVMSHEGTPDFTLYAFDLHNEPEMYATERYYLLQRKVADLPADVQAKIVVVEKFLVQDKPALDTLYEQALELGYEGLITQTLTGLYHQGKTSPKTQVQQKLKPHADRDAEIVEVHEALHNENKAFTNEVGETKRSTHSENKSGLAMVGGFTVRDTESGAVFRIGAGKLDHDARRALWLAGPEKLVGLFCKYRSMDYGTMTNGAARMGRFYQWRDKSDLSIKEST